MHFTERNHRNLMTLRAILQAKGYTVAAYAGSSAYCNGEGAFSSVEFYHPEHKAATLRTLYIPSSAAAREGCFEADVQSAFETFLTYKVRPIITAQQSIAAAVMRQFETIRELAPDAELPEGWLNPIEALADRIRTNILPAPSAADPTDAAPF